MVVLDPINKKVNLIPELYVSSFNPSIIFLTPNNNRLCFGDNNGFELYKTFCRYAAYKDNSG